MLIAFDADGPLFDFMGELCTWLKFAGLPYSPSRALHWELAAWVLPQDMHVVRNIMGTAGFCSSLPWMPGAKQLVQALRDDGHDVICVTSPHRSRHWAYERTERLLEIFDANDILLVKGPRKALVRADVLVEDHPGNAAKWCEANPAGVALLVDRPWNGVRAKEWACHPGMVRVQDDRILSWIRGL